MSINLHIERLILDGLSLNDAQGPLIGATVETELARLLTTGGLEASLRSGGAWASVPGGGIQLAPSESVQLGQQIAQAVYRGIGQEQSPTSRTGEGGLHASQN